MIVMIEEKLNRGHTPENPVIRSRNCFNGKVQRGLLKIVGTDVEMFCELDPKLKEFVTKERGKKVLYVQLDKALYGCIRSALLWWEMYSSTLKDMGFELSEYDQYVANATIDGRQCTIC